MSTLSIRPATTADIDSIVDFSVTLANEIGTRINRKTVRDGVTEFIAGTAHGQYFLASQEGMPIGQVVIKPVIMEPWKKSHIIWVDDFYITPVPDKVDIMKALLKHGIAWAVPHEHEQVVRLFCPHSHRAMMYALLCLGFTPIGIMMEQNQKFVPRAGPETVEIREATKNDIDILTRFTVKLATNLGDEINQKLVGDGIAQFIADNRHGKYFIAMVDGQPAGQMIVKNTLLEPWRRSHISWIDDAYVDAPYRGRGIMRALLQHSTRWGSAHEFEQIVRLYCAFDNHEGLTCWTGLQFEPIGFMMQQRQDVFL